MRTTHTTEELGALLGDYLNDNPVFGEVISLVRQNSEGKIWLVGSAVYRTLAHLIYGSALHIKDWDFLVERSTSSLSCASGWEGLRNRYGNPKFKKDALVVDIFPLGNITSIKKRNLPPHLDHYLTGTPFTIQSIAFDVEHKALVGEIGIRSILTKTVSINYREEYEDARAIYGDSYTAKKYVDGLGFSEI